MFASAARPSAAAGKRVADTKANIPPKHLQVLPLGKNKTQKVVVGDSTGVVQCFSVKAGDVALAWLLRQPAVTAPIVGPRTIEQLDGGLRALDITLDEAALARIDEIFPGPGGTAPEAYAW